jgi:hypothetical protein
VPQSASCERQEKSGKGGAAAWRHLIAEHEAGWRHSCVQRERQRRAVPVTLLGAIGVQGGGHQVDHGAWLDQAAPAEKQRRYEVLSVRDLVVRLRTSDGVVHALDGPARLAGYAAG